MFGSLASCKSQKSDSHRSNVPEGAEATMSRKREASPGLGLPPSTYAEGSGSACAQKRRQTLHGGLASCLSAQAPSEGNALLHDFNEPSSPPRHNLLQISYGTQTCSSAQQAQDAAAASTETGIGRHSTHLRDLNLLEHWSNGVSAEAACFAFQHDDMDFKTADDSWLEPTDTNHQKDCPQPTPALNTNAGTHLFGTHPSTTTAQLMTPLQHAVFAAESQQAFAQRKSDRQVLEHSSLTVAPSLGGKQDAAINQQQQDQHHHHHQQQQAGRTTAAGPRLSFGGGLLGSSIGQGPLGQQRAPAFYSLGSGWPRIRAPNPCPSPTPTPAPNLGSSSTVYQFQGSSSTRGVQASSASQEGGLPGSVAVCPPVGAKTPVSNPALAAAMQPCNAGAPPGTAPPQLQQQQLQQQEQEQQILTKMQQCMVFVQKMQQLLHTGRSVSNEPLTDELRETYHRQGNAVVAQYNRLGAQYQKLHQDMVNIGSGQPTETLMNQQRLAAEAARYAASLQGSAQGPLQGATPPAQGGPHCPALTGQSVPARSAGMANHASTGFAHADAVADDFDRDLQAALAASVTHQPGKWVNATHSTDVKPDEKLGEKISGATCPSRAVPCNAFTAEEAAQVDEITRLTAEPLMLRAQNGGGVVWQNERDPSVPKSQPKSHPPTRPAPTTPLEYVPPHGNLDPLDTAAKPETNLVSAAAAAVPVPASAEADSTPGGSKADSDSCAEKVAELSLEANPAGLQLVKEVKDEEEDLSLLKALSKKELQAYGPQPESGYTSADLCEDVDDLDVCDGVDEDSQGAVSDTCSEEQEDFQAVRQAADKEAVSKAAEDAQLQNDWVLAEADGSEWI